MNNSLSKQYNKEKSQEMIQNRYSNCYPHLKSLISNLNSNPRFQIHVFNRIFPFTIFIIMSKTIIRRI